MLVVLIEFFSPATLQNFLWLEGLISRTTFRVKEPKELLKCVGICRVSKEGTLTLHLDKPLVSKFVEVMGKGRIWNIELLLNFSDYEPVRMRGQQQLHNAEPRLDAHGGKHIRVFRN